MLNESLRGYIYRFSRQCDTLPDVVDADIISAFLSRMTCKTLVHKLSCQKPHTTRNLLDIATNHASDEEAVEAVFSGGRDKGKAKREGQDEVPYTQQGKKNKKDRCCSTDVPLGTATKRPGPMESS